MKRLISTIYIFTFLIFGITNYTFSQSLIGVWDKVLGPGDPIAYDFQDDSTIIIHFQDSLYTTHYATSSISSSDIREIDLGQNGVMIWRGIYKKTSDSSVLNIEGYWHTGLPPVQPPTAFNDPTTYNKLITLIGVWDKVLGPGDPIEYNFQNDSTVIIHSQTRTDTAHYTTFSIPSSYERGIDLGLNGVVAWRGLYQFLSDSSVLRIEGYWHTGLPTVQTPISFIDPTTYNKIFTGIAKNENEIPRSFSLSHNYPNPFNPSTIIKYAIPFESTVNFRFYNSLGQIVREVNEGSRQPGSYEINFNSSGLASGIYFYSIRALSADGKNDFNAVKKMMLLK